MRRLGMLVAVVAALGCHRDLDVCPDDACLELDSGASEEASTGDAELETGTPSGDSDTTDSDPPDTIADSGAEERDADAADALAESGSDAAGDSEVVDSTVTDTSGADTGVVDTFVADTFVPDTYVADTFVADTFVADTFVADTYVAPPSCTDAGPASEPCGKCGTRTRTCVAPGTWGAWGVCSGEGVCTPGEVAAVATACGGALEKKTKTCTASCTWGAEVCALPKGWTAIADAPIEGRVQNSAVWTGGELIVFGGGTSIDGGPGMSDGAVYSVLKNSWQVLPTNTSPTAKRKRHVACWTGTEMVVWGGLDGAVVRGDGYVYNAFSKNWYSTTASPLAARQRSAGIWIPTTKRFFIWGGDGDTSTFADGALFDPSSSTWTMLPAAPLSARYWSYVVWTGKEVVVWGGRTFTGVALSDGAAFDPATGAWRTLATAAGSGRLFASVGMTSDSLIVFGGSDLAGTDYWDGLKLTVAGSSSWSSIAAPPSTLLQRRAWQQAWFAGDRMTLWGGLVDGGGGEAVFDPNGATFDAKTGAWTALDITGAPTPRALATTLWTGNYAIVWSGMAKPGGGIIELVTSGALYVP